MHETRAIVIQLPPVRVSCVCTSAHVTRAVPIVFKLSRGKAFFRPVFGKATPSTGASVASSRSHCELVYRIVAELGFVKFTWHEPLLIIK